VSVEHARGTAETGHVIVAGAAAPETPGHPG